MGASDSAYALLVCVWMAGMVCGATALARRVPSPLSAAGALIALAVQGAGMGIQTTWAILPVAFSGYLMGGLGHGVKNVLLRTLFTARVPDRLHGRAFAAYNAARNTAELAAIGAGGLLVNALGPRGALVIAGLGPLVAAAAGLTGLRGRRPGRAALRGPRPAGRLSPLTTRLAVRPDDGPHPLTAPSARQHKGARNGAANGLAVASASSAGVSFGTNETPARDGVGSPGASQPPAPTDPGVTVSRHRALLISLSTCGPRSNGRTGRGLVRAPWPTTD